MSCSFDVKKCLNCMKYNGCLLQTVYKNTLSLATLIDNLSTNQKNLMNEVSHIKSKYMTTDEDNLDLSTDLNEVLTKINNIDKKMTEYCENNDEMMIDVSQVKNSLSLLDLKVDDLVQRYNDVEE